MNSIVLNTEEVNSIQPKFFLVSQVIGTDDILVCTGEEILQSFIDDSFIDDCEEEAFDPKNPTLDNALRWWTNGDTSGNTHNITLWSEVNGHFLSVNLV